MRDCKKWNKAMLLKILWDIHSNKSNLWIKWIHVYYLRGKDIWLWHHSKADHPIFKNLQALRNSLIDAGGTVSHAKQILNSWYKGGKFNTSMAYDWLRIRQDKKPWMSLIWRKYIPPKISFILWLTLKGKINTKNSWINQPEDM